MAELGRVGVWLGALGWAPAAVEREVAAEVDELGYGALWYSEAHNGKESLSHGAVLLGATRRIVVASGIANIWVRDPMAMVAGANALAEAFPGRFLLGLGVSHPPQVDPRGHAYRKPVATMRAYLEAMDARRVHGTTAGGAGSARARGTAARDARARGGDGRRGAPVPRARRAHPARASDSRSRQAARDRAVRPAGGRPSRGTQARARGARVVPDAPELHRQPALARLLGDDDLSDGGSDTLVDALVAWGDEEAIRGRVLEHLEAGADHVCIQPVGSGSDSIGIEHLRRLGPALLGPLGCSDAGSGPGARRS